MFHSLISGRDLADTCEVSETASDTVGFPNGGLSKVFALLLILHIGLSET